MLQGFSCKLDSAVSCQLLLIKIPFDKPILLQFKQIITIKQDYKRKKKKENNNSWNLLMQKSLWTHSRMCVYLSVKNK